MARPKKNAIPTDFWDMAKYFERRMSELDQEEAAAIEAFKAEREELKASIPKPVLDAVRAKSRLVTDDAVSEPERLAAQPEPKPLAPKPDPKPQGDKPNGATKQQPQRAQA